MKKFLAILAMALGIPVFAQTTTTYVGTIKDLTGAPVTSGRVTWTLSVKIATLPGTGAFTSTTVSCNINGSGTPVSAQGGACTITNNTALTPTGTYYTMCIQPGNITPGSCIATYATGGTVDISTLVPTPTTQPNYGITASGCPLTGCTMTGAFAAPSVSISSGGSTVGLNIGRVDARSCSGIPLVYTAGTDVTSALQSCVNTFTSVYLPAQYEVTSLRLPPGHSIWCDNRQFAGLLQNPAGSGNPGGGDANYATLAIQSDASNVGVGVHGCLINGNKAAIYANPSNPGNTQAIAGIVIEHQNATGGHPDDEIEGTTVENTTGDGIYVGPHVYDDQFQNDRIYGADNYGLHLGNGPSDVAFSGFNIGQSAWSGVFEDDGSNVRLSHFKVWFSGQGISGSLTAVANAGGSTAVYSGTIANCSTQNCVGRSISVSGFTNSVNNGTFTIAAYTAGSLTLNNSNAVAETHAATAFEIGPNSVAPGNYFFLNSASSAGNGGWTMANLESQDALGSGFYFHGNGSQQLVGVHATGLQDDSGNYSLQGSTTSGLGACYDLSFLSNSIIQGTCGKWEQATPGVPAHAVNISNSAGNLIAVVPNSISAQPITGDPTSMTANRIEWARTPIFGGTFASTYTPTPELNAVEEVTLTGNITIGGTQTSQTLAGMTMGLFLIEDATGGRTVTWNGEYFFPTSCSIDTAANAVNYFQFQALTNSSWALTSCSGSNAVAGVSTINGTGGAYTFSGSGVSCTGTTCTFSGGGASLPASIPVVATNGSGTAVAATAANVGSLFPCTSGSPYVTNISGSPGCSGSTTTTQRGVDAVVAGGLSTGASDNSSTWLSFLASNCQSTACDVHIPCGTYKVSNVVVPVTNGTYSSTTITGDGKATYTGKNCVEFDVTSPGGWGLWWDNTSTGAGNNGGPTIRNISFRDVTTASQCNTTYGSNSVANHPSFSGLPAGYGNCAAGGIRFTQINYGTLVDVATYAFVGILNWDGANNGGGTGNITVTNGSQTATCGSCTFTSAMVFGHLWVNGEPQEICKVSGSTATLCSNWEFSTNTTTNWNVDYNGVGRMWDGSSISGCTSSLECFSQYWDIRDSWGYAERVSFDFVGDNTTACWAGTSRFFITGGATNGEHLGDNIGLWIGKCGDTVNYENAQNNVAIHAVIEDGHANSIRGIFENSTNSAAITPIYTCNGGAPLKSCTKGVLMNCETSGECKNNTVVDGYILGVGNGIEINNESVINGFHIANVRMDTNTANYVWDDGKTCKTQTSTDIDQPDCRAFQATTVNVNNSTMTFTNTTPSGSCTVGDEWHNTAGSTGSIFYICGTSNTWHDIY